jgi:hypothetical protein
MRESWMVDGETSVMIVMKISSKSPSQQGARTEFLSFRITVSDGGGAAEVYLGKTSNPRSFQVRGYM